MVSIRCETALRGNPSNFFLIVLLAAGMHSFPAGPDALAVTGPAEQTVQRAEDIERIARLPDEKISLLPALFTASAEGVRTLTGRPPDAAFVAKEVDRMAWRVSAFLVGAREPRRAIGAINRVLFADEGFAYDAAAGDPENYLLERVIARKRGNCLGLTFLFMALGERLGVPLQGSYVPTHCFARYEENGVRINIETGEKGADREDRWYAETFRLGEGRPYLRTLGKREMIGVYLKTLGAALSRRGMEEEALRAYGRAALFNPGLPDVYYNAGVSYQKLGRHDEAADQYRKALALDPDMACARGNLGATLCSSGRTEEGIREYLKAAAVEPDNVKVRSGLAKAYFSKGAYLESIAHCDRAMAQGCSFEPSMLEVLDRYRLPGAVLR